MGSRCQKAVLRNAIHIQVRITMTLRDNAEPTDVTGNGDEDVARLGLAASTLSKTVMDNQPS
jgi:hypothetical protein